MLTFFLAFVFVQVRKITSTNDLRLLFMGRLTAPEYDSLDREPPLHETQAGAVKHNGETGLGTEDSPSFQEQTRDPETTEPAAAMAEDPMIQPDSESQAAAASAGGAVLDLTFGIPIKERPIWVDLYESVRDVFFPPKYPPLVLTSTPIPVPDRMAVKRNPVAWGLAATINGTILVIVLFFVGKHIIENKGKPLLNLTDIDVGVYTGPMKDKMAGGGGGGGDHSIVDASKGKLPKLEKNPVEPPQVQTVDKPKLPMEAAINVQDLKLPDNPLLPNIGMKNSVNVKLDSNGQGSGSGMGTGSGGGIGSGNGNGYGPGTGGGAGGGLYSVGGGVSTPVLIHSVEAEFSDEARRAKYQGVCLVSIIVDRNGVPQNPRVVRPLGMGLDEKALEAIKQYRFKPAMKDGKTAVPVMINVEIDFRLY
jgi:TonB family protein